MAAYTGSVTGNWADTATWGGSGPPVAGDTVTINTGITVTVPVSTTATMGTSPTSATAAAELTLSGTAQLVINGTLNVRAPLDVTGGGIVTINGGGVLNIDPSNQATTTEYRCRFGVSGTGKLVLNDNATITAPATYSWYHAGGAVTNAGQIDVNGSASNYALIQRMRRSSSNIGWTPGLNISSAGKYEFSHCIIDECDDFSFTGTGTFSITIEWCRWQNGTGTQCLILNTSTVTKNVSHCTFDKNPNLSGGWATSSIVATEVYFGNNYTTGGGTTGNFGGSDWCIKRGTAQDGPIPFLPPSGGELLCRELLWHNTTDANPHGGSIKDITGARTSRGAVYQCDSTATAGDNISGNLSSGLLTYADIMHLPNSNGVQTGAFYAALASNITNIAFQRCTFPYGTGGPHSISVAEGAYNDTTGFVTSIKDVLAFDDGTGQTSEAIFQVQENVLHDQPDPLVPAGADYNAVESATVNTAAEAYSDGSSTITQTIPTAANDVYATSFDFIAVDDRLEDWAAWWGTRIGANGDGTNTPNADATTTNAHLLLRQMHDGTLPEATTENALRTAIQWVTRGRIPRSTLIRANGSDGKSRGYMGAWAPAITIDSVSASGLSATTNAPDGTYYVILVPDGDQPNWFQDVIDGLDGSLAAVPAANIFTGAVASTTISCTFTGASLGGGDYRAVLVHVADDTANGWIGQEVYLRASEPAVSAAFQAAAASSSDSGLSRPVFGMRGGKRVLLKRVRPTITAQAA